MFLVVEIIVIVLVFILFGFIEIYVIFVCYFLMIVVLFGLILGEKVGWCRWVVIGVGFVGVFIIL